MSTPTPDKPNPRVPRMSAPTPPRHAVNERLVSAELVDGASEPLVPVAAVTDKPAGLVARSPVVVGTTITAGIPAIISALVALGVIRLDLVQQDTLAAAILALVAIVSGLVGGALAWWHATPVARPRDQRGVPLIPADQAADPVSLPPVQDGGKG